MNRVLSCVVLILALAAGCTRENTAFCCIDPADCAAQGVQEESRFCSDNLSCVDNKCVASTCAASGCSSTAPVCEIPTDTCIGCMDSTDCMRFPATDVCDTTSGACVECMSAIDCDATKPVCDASACRTCRVDSECPSGACAEDGSCVAEANAVYLSPTGTDAVPCSRAQPCHGLLFAVQQTNPGRYHVVLAGGTYDSGTRGIAIGVQSTAALKIIVHGGGATLLGGSSDFPGLTLGLPAVLRDLSVHNETIGSSVALDLFGTTTLERVHARGFDGISARGNLTAKELVVHAERFGLLNTGTTTIDGATMTGGLSAILSRYGSLDATNLVASGTTGVVIDIDGSSGSLVFATIFSTAPGTEPAGVRCLGGQFTVRSSIVWTPTSPSRVGLTGCNLVSSIVGPVGVVGAMSTDPLFVSSASNDFHLSGGSPARDVVDSGPAFDFEGDPRPRGARFDIGADEAP